MQFPSSLPSVQTCCAVSPDSAHFLGGSSGSNSLGAELTLWDRRNEKRFIREFKGHSESVQDCMFMSVEVEKAEPNWYDYSDADVYSCLYRRLPYVAFLRVCSVGSDSNVILWNQQSAGKLVYSLL